MEKDVEGGGSGLIQGICLEGLRKTSKAFSQEIRSQCRDLNLVHSKHEAAVLTPGPRCSAVLCKL
jgi:hypothetical protein